MTSAMLMCGIDSAEAHHDVARVDDGGKVVARKRVSADLPGFTALLDLLAGHSGSPEQTPVAIELRIDRHVHAIPGEQPPGLTVRALARQHQEAI